MRREQIIDRLARLPGLRTPAGRRRLRLARDAALRARRRTFERMGIDRYSRPALGEVDRHLQAVLPDRGFFVEAGAHDGFTQSNTYLLERFRGWTGLLVEPVPELFRQAQRERRGSRVVNCALVAPERAGQTIRVHHAGLMSLVEGARGDAGADRAHLAAAAARPFPVEQYTVEVPARTLSELLDEMAAPEVDFLALDLEGYEAQALAGLDLRRHAPRHILVEALDEAAAERIAGTLGPAYRQVARLPPNDLLFERRG